MFIYFILNRKFSLQQSLCSATFCDSAACKYRKIPLFPLEVSELNMKCN